MGGEEAWESLSLMDPLDLGLLRVAHSEAVVLARNSFMQGCQQIFKIY